MSTSGRVHSEFLRLLYFLADRQASDYFTAHKGGHGITPIQESSMTGFYSATARFISWLAKLEHKAHWLPGGQDLQDPSTWTNSRLIALKQVHQELIYSRTKGVIGQKG